MPWKTKVLPSPPRRRWCFFFAHSQDGATGPHFRHFWHRCLVLVPHSCQRVDRTHKRKTLKRNFSHSKKHLFEYSKGLSSRIHKKTQKYMKRQSLEFAWFFEKKEGKTNGDQTIASKVSRRNRARTTRLTSVQEGEIWRTVMPTADQKKGQKSEARLCTQNWMGRFRVDGG